MEFVVEKIGMSRTIGVKSEAVTLIRIVDSKVCELLENGKAIVAFKKGKSFNKPIAGQQKNTALARSLIILRH